MSKYFDDLSKQLKGKDLKQFTEEIKASHNISKGLKEQAFKEKHKKIRKEIEKLLAR